MDLVKMLAGTYSVNVNAKTGYTPCHLALQFGHEEIYKILVESYGADPNVRDYSGRKPRQYQTNQDTSLSADTYRSEYAREKPSTAAKLLLFGSLPRPKRRAKKTRNMSSLSFSHAVQVVTPTSKFARDKHCGGGGGSGGDSTRPAVGRGKAKLNARKHKHMEKDLRFLRIGSLNVRVKRTTEAFSNFLGVGHNAEKIHKTWGSADNIQQNDAKRMPPPKSVTIKKRKSKRPQDFLRRASAPADRSPDKRKSAEIVTGDSDSDTACGFGTNWQPS
ncbi:hypothetical protein AGLY_008130 [Aphis glycines]|uniref:Uncharacterized protein n=1 Tax=Aphis glycines TaxID=307491 RepID=A0A6G0TL61_APHGL|nr:hypothetical protein AGLY_008130 [Aphis glycines]